MVDAETHYSLFNERCSRVCLVSTSNELQAAVQQRCGEKYVIFILSAADLTMLSKELLDRIFGRVTAVLFDWNIDSAGFLYEVRQRVNPFHVPLFALCGMAQEDHVAALFMGADGVLSWPLQPVLFEAYLLSHRRRFTETPFSGDGMTEAYPVSEAGVAVYLSHDHEIDSVGPITLDRTARRFFVLDHEVQLTPKEYDLMAYLIGHVGTCQTRDHLLNDALCVGFDTGTNILDVHIYEIRKKLRAFGFDKMIQTVRGVGYRFTVPAEGDECHPSCR